MGSPNLERVEESKGEPISARVEKTDGITLGKFENEFLYLDSTSPFVDQETGDLKGEDPFRHISQKDE